VRIPRPAPRGKGNRNPGGVKPQLPTANQPWNGRNISKAIRVVFLNAKREVY